MTSRDQDIHQRRERGDTFRAIGSQYGLSPGRVREIYLKQERLAKATKSDEPDFSVRAFNIVCHIAEWEKWWSPQQYKERHDINGYLARMRTLVAEGRLTMRRGLLYYGIRPIVNCGKICSAEIWQALQETSPMPNSLLLTNLRIDIQKIRLGRDAAELFTLDRTPPENGILNIELLEEAAAYLESLEQFGNDRLTREEFAKGLVEWASK